MSELQKGIVAFGVAVILLSTLFAPFNYTASNEMARLFGEANTRFEGSFHGPIWRGKSAAIDYVMRDHPIAEGMIPKLEHVELDSARMGLYWGAIVILTSAAAVLAKRPLQNS